MSYLDRTEAFSKSRNNVAAVFSPRFIVLMRLASLVIEYFGGKQIVQCELYT